MPLTGALVLIWVFLENKGDPETMQSFVKGALGGILPSFLFSRGFFLSEERSISYSCLILPLTTQRKGR
jgi:hypothetical protein